MSGVLDFHGLALFVVYLVAGLVMLAIFTRLYMWVTPYDEASEISKDHLAPAIALAGAMLGFTFPLLVASYTHSNIWGFFAWGAVACIAQLIVFWVLHWLLPKVIETNNTAGATCFAAASVCVGLINAASFIP